MAITKSYHAVPPPDQLVHFGVYKQQVATAASAPPPPAPEKGIDIDAWTLNALESLSVSPTARGTGVTLSIPLDAGEQIQPAREPRAAGAAGAAATYKPRKELVRRDSQKKREALLKGKEGSRRRQRWENDRLLHVPNRQPPLPSDWEVHPTYPVHSVPYYLAPLWDAGVRHRAEEKAAAAKKRGSLASGLDNSGAYCEEKGRVPAELRQKLKKSKGAKSLLQGLEEEVRKFMKDYERSQKGAGEEMEGDSEDEEIVFVGRNGTMSDEQRRTVEEELEREKLIFDAAEGDKGASFGRWLVHSIAQYYGLTSRSVTVGDPARREAYVGIRPARMKTGRIDVVGGELPRPLWGLI